MELIDSCDNHHEMNNIGDVTSEVAQQPACESVVSESVKVDSVRVGLPYQHDENDSVRENSRSAFQLSPPVLR